MEYILVLAVATALSLPSRHMEIAVRVAGEGRPNCQSYHSDGTVRPCLPTFAVFGGGGVNGKSLAGHITFTPAATVRLNDDEFALLAGHEIAHYYLGHKTNEIAADKLGAELACKAGYDPGAGASLFRYLRKSKVHPTSAKRSAVALSASCQKI
jgi:hypothetical protein